MIFEQLFGGKVQRVIGGDNWKRKHPTNVTQPLLSSGTRVREADFPKNQRNKKCKCGSGVKFKKCCMYDVTSSDIYKVIN